MQEQQQHLIIIPSLFTEPIHHSKPTWKTISTASRIRWLNMAKWLSVSCIDLDTGEHYGEVYLPSKCAIDFQHSCQRRFSPRRMISCIFSHLCLELLTQFNEIQHWDFLYLYINCILVNLEMNGRTQHGVSCTWGNIGGGGGGVYVVCVSWSCSVKV